MTKIGTIKLWDGTETALINASGEQQVRDDDANTDLDTIAGDTTSIDTKTPSLGQATKANSVPVTLASDEDNVNTDVQTIATGSGKTLKFTTGTCNTSGDNELIALVAGKEIHVYAFSIMMTGTTAVTAVWESGTAGPDMWQHYFDNVATGIVSGANLAVSPPSSLFHTDSGESLNLRLSAAVTMYYSVAYWEE